MIRHWIGALAGCVGLVVAAASVAAAQSSDVLSFGPGKPVPAGDVSRGQNIFNAVCWACHSSDLSGGKAPPLADSVFHKEWQGRPVQALSDYIQNRMPLDDPGALSAQGARNLVAYIVAYSNNPKSLTGGQNGK